MTLAVHSSIFAALMLFSVLAQAAGPFRLGCQGHLCADQPITRQALNPAQASQLPAEVRLNLQKKAVELAQIWGDTILEGDYYASDETDIDSIETLSVDEKLVGYRITYSSLAWNTSDCRFDNRNLSTLNSCVEGRIVESGFVSADFKEAFQDRESPVEFFGSK